MAEACIVCGFGNEELCPACLAAAEAPLSPTVEGLCNLLKNTMERGRKPAEKLLKIMLDT